MAILYSREIFGRKFTQEGSGKKTGTRVFLRYFDTDVDDLEDVLVVDSAHDIPEIGDAWSITDTTLICKSRTPEEINKELKIYKIVCDYVTPSGSYIPGQKPWDRDWEVHWTSENREIALNKNHQALAVTNSDPASRLDTDDLPSSGTSSWFANVYLYRKLTTCANNTLVLNSANDPYDPPATAEEAWHRCELTRNYETLPANLLDYVNTCNSVAISIAGQSGRKWQWRIEDIQISNEKENSDKFYRVTYIVIKAPHTHLKVILNSGYNAWDSGTAGTTKKPILNDDGSAIDTPAPLDYKGIKIDKSNVLTDSIYFAYADVITKNFATLGLPTTMDFADLEV